MTFYVSHGPPGIKNRSFKLPHGYTTITLGGDSDGDDDDDYRNEILHLKSRELSM